VGQSRYIPRSVDKRVKEESGFRCSWCGCYLTVRHHIYPHSLGGPHSEDNLILLCPNCHTDVHSGRIHEEDLRERKTTLTGRVDRSSGILSVNKEYLRVDIGGFRCINCKNILLFNSLPLISVRNDNGYLLLSLRLFNENDRLICWMSENRWWIDNEETLDFQFTKSRFSITGSSGQNVFDLAILDDSVKILGTFNLLGDTIQLLEDSVSIMGKAYLFGCASFGDENAIAIVEKSFTEPIEGRIGWKINI